MSLWLWIRNNLTWGRVVSLVKAVAVISAFLAFAINMRQKELDRFNTIKPLFEIEASTNATSFKLINHGGNVYFRGCDEQYIGKLLTDEKKACKLVTRLLTGTPKQYSTPSEKNACKLVTRTPRRYSTLRNNQTEPEEFQFSELLSNDDFIVLYWRDIDENDYELKIKWGEDGFYIAGSPKTFRAPFFFAIGRPSLDRIVNFVFPKDWFSNPKCWFSDKALPKDKELKVAPKPLLRMLFWGDCSTPPINPLDTEA